MKTRVSGNIMAVRLMQGEDVVSSLEKAFQESGGRLGILLGGAGMMKDVRIGYFMGRGTYKENLLPEPREIVSAAGNFVNSADGFFTHLHVSLADDDSRVLGGHLEEATVHGTGEFFILISDIEATRTMEDETGLKGLKL